MIRQRYCIYPNCSNIAVGSKYCATHKQKRQQALAQVYDEQRGSAQDRGYDARWAKVRLAQLRESPVCQHCHDAVAVLVHHVKPIAEGGDVYDPNNLLSVCASCHRKIHRELDKRRQRQPFDA